MLAPLGDVRPGERRGAAAAFLTIFGILAGHTLLETARDALFLARLPPSELPGVYLVMAVVAIAVFQGPWRAPRAGGRYGLSIVLVSSGIATFVFWAVHSSHSPWALRALYVWTGILGTLAALRPLPPSRAALLLTANVGFPALAFDRCWGLPGLNRDEREISRFFSLRGWRP